MRIRFYIDPVTGRPHVENHGITKAEATQAFERANQDYAGYGGARIAIGPTTTGRVLKVIYKPEQGNSAFVITAYRIRGNELRAYYRRLRRRGTR